MNKQIKATLIVNAFLSSAQTDETYKWIVDSAIRHDISITLMTNTDFFVRLDEASDNVYLSQSMTKVSNTELGDFIIFWNKDTCLARALENLGYRLYNPSDAIEWCDNKAHTFEILSRNIKSSQLTSTDTSKYTLSSIIMPKTIKIPMTFDGVGYNKHSFIDYLANYLGYPFVIKECWGSYGGQVYLASTKDEAVEIFTKVDGTECIAEEYISKSFGRDLRAYVVGDKVVAAMERRNDHDFRANITNGGSSLPYDITADQEEMAVAAAKALHLDFAGVDLLFMDNDKPILCEVNSNAQFLGLYEATGVNIPDKIFEYILSSY